MNRLLHEHDAVAEKRKMEGLEWAEQARGYQTTIEKCVVNFRMALINDFGNQEEGQELLEA